MSHAGNWRRNPRKMALEIRRARDRELMLAAARLQREGDEAAEKVEREGGYVVTFYDHGPDIFVMGLTPCITFAYLQSTAEATCFGCRKEAMIAWSRMAHTRLTHVPWPTVMPRLTCSACGGRPETIRFRSGDPPLSSRSGALSVLPPPKRVHLF